MLSVDLFDIMAQGKKDKRRGEDICCFMYMWKSIL
jgi:hypothetical protein